MLVSINLVANASGMSMYSINCHNEDLESGFLTAINAFASEVFRSEGLQSINLGNVYIQTLLFDEYKLMLVFDRVGEDRNEVVINQIKKVFKEEKEEINRSLESRTRLSNMSNFSVKLMDAVSDSFSNEFNNDTLVEISKTMERIIFYRDGTNLYFQLRLVMTKVKVGNLLGENTTVYGDLIEKISNKLAKKTDEAEEYLHEIKNLIYSEYAITGDINAVPWTDIYSLFDDFLKALKQITRSEVVEKYLRLTSEVIDGKIEEKSRSDIADELMNLDDDIESYIKF